MAAEPTAKAEGGPPAAAGPRDSARAKDAAKSESRTSGKGEKKAKEEGKKEGGADGGKAGKAGKAAGAAKGAASAVKKGAGDGKAKGAGGVKADGEGEAAGDAASDAEHRAAIEIQRVARGRAARKRLYEMYVTTSKDGAPAALAAAGAGKKPGLNLKDVKGSKHGKLSSKRSSSDKGSKRDHPGTPTSAQRRSPKGSPRGAPSPAVSASKPPLERKSSSGRGGDAPGAQGSPDLAAQPAGAPRSPSPTRRKSPRKPLNLNDQRIQSELHGWVTLAVGGEAFVTKMTGRLPPHLRRQHSEQWAIRTSIDSERERERAAWREEVGGGDLMTMIPRAIIPHNHRLPSPRNAYFTVGVADPGGIGFAYGGVYPGKLHAKGQLVEQHEVRFSVGIAGSYLLYVSLRPPHTPWPVGGAASNGGEPTKMSPRGMPLQGDWQLPGSPFLLRVAPGRAYPLSTQLPPDELPVRGGKVTVKLDKNAPDVWTAAIVIKSRDKMGNLCEKNQGEEITAGFLGGGTAPAASGEAGEAGAEAGAAAATAKEADAKAAGDAKGEAGGKPKESERRGSIKPPAAPEVVDVKPAAPDEGLAATVTDMKNGSYKVKWTSNRPGTFNVFVKIDGLHVLGSPAKMLLSTGVAGVPSPKKAAASGGGGAAA